MRTWRGLSVFGVILATASTCNPPPPRPQPIVLPHVPPLTRDQFLSIGYAAGATPWAGGSIAGALGAKEQDVANYENDICQNPAFASLGIETLILAPSERKIPAFEALFEETAGQCFLTEQALASLRASIEAKIAYSNLLARQLKEVTAVQASSFCSGLKENETVTSKIAVKAAEAAHVISEEHADLAELAVTLAIEFCPELSTAFGS